LPSFIPCDIWGSHSGVAEDSSLPGCDSVSLGQCFMTFRRIVVPSFSGSRSLRSGRLVLKINALRSLEKHRELSVQRNGVTCEKVWVFKVMLKSLSHTSPGSYFSNFHINKNKGNIFPTTQNISTPKEMVRIGNATDEHVQGYMPSNELLLPILKIFAQFTRCLHATRIPWCFQSVGSGKTVCRFYQQQPCSLYYSQRSPAPRQTRPTQLISSPALRCTDVTRHCIQTLLLCTYVQCAAVRIHSLEIREPPQKSELSMERATCHGNWPRTATYPLVIRKSGFCTSVFPAISAQT
jgi:hypothetical protein